MYSFVRFLAIAFFRAASRMTILGVENVPAEGGFLLTTNHLSFVDPELILAAVPRRIRVFAAVKYRRNPFIHYFFDAMGCVWVRQFEADHQALREAINHLKSGGVLGMSPEGTRSKKTHALARARGGAAMLASRSGAPVLPVAVWGTETFFRDLRRLRRPRIFARIGKPYALSAPARAKGTELDAATDEIMLAIAALLPNDYRGEYAADPRSAARASEAGG